LAYLDGSEALKDVKLHGLRDVEDQNLKYKFQPFFVVAADFRKKTHFIASHFRSRVP
jgi:hypothetical protein